MLDKHRLINALLAWYEDVQRDGTPRDALELSQEINELINAIEDGLYDAD